MFMVFVKKMKGVYFLLYLPSIFILSRAQSMVSQPQAFTSENFTSTQEVDKSCSFVLVIKTSCSSVQFTRDHISLTFGDDYGNKVYEPRIDDPTSRRFERCVTDSIEVSGVCMYQICRLSLLRTGSDGWKPETVTIYGFNTRPVTFYYKMFIPKGIWFGFNHCSKAL